MMRLFRGLLPSQSREEFEILAQKLKQQENAPIPRADLSITRLMVAVRTREIEDLLSSLGDSAQAPLDTRLVIEGTMGHLRRDVFLMSFERFRRYLAASRIQRTILRLLYLPRKEGVPLVSRCLVRDGVLQPTGGASEVGAIGGGGVAEDAHADRASPAAEPRRGQCRVSLPPLLFERI